ncbi:MAG: DUF2752 domain-containing protein [Tepidisphaeraceae bacterium]
MGRTLRRDCKTGAADSTISRVAGSVAPVLQNVPRIYSRPPEARKLTGRGRCVALGIALCCIAPLITALFITPSPTGVGTHQELGLRPCQFERQFGVPCPTCGMTTSFAYFVRGRLLPSLYVQPMGTMLAFSCGMVSLTAVYELMTGRALHRLLRMTPAGYYLWTAFALLIVAWAWKIGIHVTGHDGWGR